MKKFLIIFFLIFFALPVLATDYYNDVYFVSPALTFSNNALRLSGICFSDTGIGTVTVKSYLSKIYNSNSDFLLLGYSSGATAPALITLYCSEAGTRNDTPIEHVAEYIKSGSTCTAPDSSDRANGLNQSDFLSLTNFDRALQSADTPFSLHIVPIDYVINCTSSIASQYYSNLIPFIIPDVNPTAYPTFPPEATTTVLSTSTVIFYDYGTYDANSTANDWDTLSVQYATTSDFTSEVFSYRQNVNANKSGNFGYTISNLPVGIYYRRYKFDGLRNNQNLIYYYQTSSAVINNGTSSPVSDFSFYSIDEFSEPEPTSTNPIDHIGWSIRQMIYSAIMPSNEKIAEFYETKDDLLAKAPLNYITTLQDSFSNINWTETTTASNFSLPLTFKRYGTTSVSTTVQFLAFSPISTTTMSSFGGVSSVNLYSFIKSLLSFFLVVGFLNSLISMFSNLWTENASQKDVL